MSSNTSKNLFLTTIPVSKVKKLAQYCLNSKLARKTFELKKRRYPIEEKFQTEKLGKVAVQDETGKVKVGEDGKVVMRDLTDKEKTELKQFVSKHAVERQALEDELKAISRSRIKFNDNLGFMLTVLYDDLAKNMLVNGADNALLEGKSQVNINLTLKGLDKNFKYYDLVRNLSSYMNAARNIQYEMDQAVLREANRVKKQGKGKKKKTEDGSSPDDKEKGTETAAETTTAPARIAPVETKELSDIDKLIYNLESPFQLLTYVNHVAKSIICPTVLDGDKLEEVKLVKYKDIKFSGETKKLVATILFELTKKICYQCVIWLDGGKVISEKQMRNILQGMMDSSTVYEEQIEYGTEKFMTPEAKLKVTDEMRKEEKEKRKAWKKSAEEAKKSGSVAPKPFVSLKDQFGSDRTCIMVKFNFDNSTFSQFELLHKSKMNSKINKKSELMNKADIPVAEIYVQTAEELEKKKARKQKKEATETTAEAVKETVEAPAPVKETVVEAKVKQTEDAPAPAPVKKTKGKKTTEAPAPVPTTAPAPVVETKQETKQEVKVDAAPAPTPKKRAVKATKA